MSCSSLNLVYAKILLLDAVSLAFGSIYGYCYLNDMLVVVSQQLL